MPFFDDSRSLENFPQSNNLHPFWTEYKNCYTNSLAEAEKNNMDAFDEVSVSS